MLQQGIDHLDCNGLFQTARLRAARHKWRPSFVVLDVRVRSAEQQRLEQILSRGSSVKGLDRLHEHSGTFLRIAEVEVGAMGHQLLADDEPHWL